MNIIGLAKTNPTPAMAIAISLTNRQYADVIRAWDVLDQAVRDMKGVRLDAVVPALEKLLDARARMDEAVMATQTALMCARHQS